MASRFSRSLRRGLVTVGWVVSPLLAATAVTAATSIPAGAAVDGPCPTGDGVTVVVDFQTLGGGVVTRCATGTYDNGLAALAGAGFTVSQPINTPGFVCRIDNAPTAAIEQCVDTPPQNAYWGYWRAARGGAWKYSDVGAASKGTAKAGTVQGWSFSDGSNPPPRAAPAASAPPATTTPPTAPATAAPASPDPQVAQPGAGASGAPSATVLGATTARGGQSAPTTVAATVAAPTTSAAPMPEAGAPVSPGETSTTTTPEVTTTTGRADATDPTDIELAASRRAEGSEDEGSPLATIAGVLIVLTLAGGAQLLRRRRD